MHKKDPYLLKSISFSSRWLLWVVACLIIVFIAAIFVAPFSGENLYGMLFPKLYSRAAGEPVLATDWPQYQHDENRTGYNPVVTAPKSYAESWSYRFENDGLAGTTQPIIVSSELYIGTEKGNVYSFNLTSVGTPQIRWQKQLDGAVTHTMAADANHVYAATLAGSVYAFSRSDGSEIWHYAQPPGTASFGSAILFINNSETVVVANRKGKVHALNATNGTEKWVATLPSAILQSPTYGDGKIFVGVENMRVYALDEATGQQVWQSVNRQDEPRVYGRSFHDYSPVYANGKLILITSPEFYTFSSEDLDILREASMFFNSNISQTMVGTTTNAALTSSQNATIQWLDQNPQSQTWYVFNASDGSRAYTPGVLHSVINGGPQSPPFIVDGQAYTAFHAPGPMWQRFVFGDNDKSGLGKVNLSTGRIESTVTPLQHNGKYYFDTPSEFTLDETNNYSGAGDIVIGARCGTFPDCARINGTGQCRISNTSSLYFTADVCAPSSPPIFANNYIAHQVWNALYVFKGQ